MATEDNGSGKDIELAPTQKETPDDARLGVELGVDSNLAFVTPFNPGAFGLAKSTDEELHEVLHEEGNDLGPTIRQLAIMRRQDGQARALYRLLTLPIRAALTGATFTASEGGDEEKEFIEAVFNTPSEQGGMTVTFHHFMAQLLLGLFDGFAAFEKVIWMPEYGPLKGKYTLKKLAYRPADTITFVTDKNGGFAGLRQRAYNGGRVTDVYIEPDYSFYYAAQEEERKFYGVSFFQSAFYHYDKKVKLYFTAHLAAQRAAVGTRVGTHPANASTLQKREFAQSMANLAFAQYMMQPDGFKVEVLKEGGSFDFLNLINHHNSQMSKSILAGFFDKDQGAGQGDGSLVNFAQPGDDMFILMLRAIMDDIASSINHFIIPQLVDYNFEGGKYPEFTWGKLTDEQKSAINSLFDKLATTAAQSQGVTPEFMRALEEEMAEELGLDIDYDEVDARIAEEQQLQQQQFGAGAVDDQGNPIPQDPNNPTPPPAGGNPAAPAGGGDVAAFTKQIASLTAEDFGDEGYADLMHLAADMLDEAETLELARVQTQQGVKKYGQQIGMEIKKDGQKAASRPITIERLRSLQAQIDASQAIGDKTLTQNLMGLFEYAIRRYALQGEGKSIKSVLTELKAPEKDG